VETTEQPAASRLRRLTTAIAVGVVALALPGVAGAAQLDGVEVSAPTVTPAGQSGYGQYAFTVSGVPAGAPAEFRNGPKVGHCVQKTVGSGTAANSSLRSDPDWAPPLSGETAAERDQIKWLLLSSLRSTTNAERSAHQNAVWYITDSDPLVRPGAQELYDAAVLGAANANQTASVTANGADTCAGQTRTITVTGTAYGTGDLDIAGDGQFLPSAGVVVSADGKHADLTLDDRAAITVTVMGNVAGTLTVDGEVDESTMVQAHRDYPNTPGGSSPDRQDFAYVEFERKPISVTLNFLDCKPVVSKTVTPEFVRTFDWTISKSVDQARIVTTATTATFTYTVNLTKLAGVDSGWKATGAITVTNSTPVGMTINSISDAVDNGGVCTVTADANTPVAAGASLTVPYVCAYPDGPSALAGINTATVSWTRADCIPPIDSAVLPAYCEGTQTFSANFEFATPTQVVSDAVNVSDTFDGGLVVLDSNVTASKTYIYARVVQVPAAGTIQAHNNCAAFTTTDLPTKIGQSCLMVEVERPAGTVTPPTIPSKPAGKAKLAITKTAAKASVLAGTTGSYTIRVKNTGTAAATNVRLCDLLPDGLGFDSSSKKGSFAKGRVCWNLGTLGVGKSVSVTIKANVAKTASGSVCNSANVKASNATMVDDRACMKVTRPKQQVRGVVAVTG
jgi:uncharacterized repeat protein (TIGR01451 family)